MHVRALQIQSRYTNRSKSRSGIRLLSGSGVSFSFFKLVFVRECYLHKTTLINLWCCWFDEQILLWTLVLFAGTTSWNFVSKPDYLFIVWINWIYVYLLGLINFWLMVNILTCYCCCRHRVSSESSQRYQPGLHGCLGYNTYEQKPYA